MENKKTPMSFHVIYWITNIITGLFFLVSVGVLALYILLWTDFFGPESDLQLHIDLPGQIEYVDCGTMQYVDGDIDIKLVEASTKIHIVNTPLPIARNLALILLGVCALMFYMLFTFRQFISNVRKGQIFTINNIMRLQNISYVLVGFWVLMIVYRRVAYHLITTRLDMENVEVVSNFNSYAGILLAALFIWVLSHIFIRGLRLKEEQDLTI